MHSVLYVPRKHFLTIEHSNQAENQSDKFTWLLYRLVTGHTLWIESQLPPVSNQQVNSREARMLPVAAELLQVSCR